MKKPVAILFRRALIKFEKTFCRPPYTNIELFSTRFRDVGSHNRRLKIAFQLFTSRFYVMYKLQVTSFSKPYALFVTI